jgi:hypothetical protein
MDLRSEVKELIRVAEKLIGFAHQNGGLTDDECSVVMYYAKELEREMTPFCPNHYEQPVSK